MSEPTFSEADLVDWCNKVRKAAYWEMVCMLADERHTAAANLVMDDLLVHEYPEEA